VGVFVGVSDGNGVTEGVNVSVGVGEGGGVGVMVGVKVGRATVGGKPSMRPVRKVSLIISRLDDNGI